VIETTHGNVELSAPLTGITAAVVGVIVNLALFFAYHVFLPGGWGGALDLAAAVLGLLCLLALAYYKVGVSRVVLGAGCAGMAWQYLQVWVH
jgi:chromate transporter